MELTREALRGYLDYLRDLGIYDLYRGEIQSDAQVQAHVEDFCAWNGCADDNGARAAPKFTAFSCSASYREACLEPARSTPVLTSWGRAGHRDCAHYRRTTGCGPATCTG